MKVDLNLMKGNTKSVGIADLISCLFEMTAVVHMAHLSVSGPGSYATHMALNGLYDSLPDLLDAVAEGYQGKYGIIKTKGFTVSIPSDICKYLKEKRKYMEDNRYSFIPAKDSELHNEFDNILTSLNSTIYKLENLK